MKTNPPDEELLTRWIDGDLDAAEAARLEETLAPDDLAELRAAKAAAAALAADLRAVYPAARDVAGPDLFMHQLAHRLDRAGESSADVVDIRPSGFNSIRWLPAMAAAVLAVLAVTQFLPRDKSATTAVAPAAPDVLLSSYAPDAKVRMDASYDAGVDAVVIVLDGLKPVASPEDLVGFEPGDLRSTEARLAIAAGRTPGDS